VPESTTTPTTPTSAALSTPLANTRLSAPIDVLRVRQLFSRPGRVAASTFLRREVAQRMHERLSLIKIAPQRVLDLGCGEQQRFGSASIIGLDAAAPMLALQQGPSWQRWLKKLRGQQASLVTANFAQLPIAAASCDVLWSNLALHWHPQPDLVLAEWLRVLRLHGLLMFSCFGPDTFLQLRAAMQQIGMDQSVLPFVDLHDFGDMLVNAGYATPVMDMETITVTYPTMEKMIADVRAFGGNPLLTRQKNTLGRGVWQQLRAALESQRTADGRLPLRFEIIYGHAFKPAPKTPGEAVIRFDWPRKSG
jgi:malonyl-CoA O-methyltransferase